MADDRDHPGRRTAPALDWGRGQYERTAAALVGAAEEVVRAGHLQPGQSVLDVGCGTGSVALLAARAGARVIGVDPAPRLLDVARTLAQGEGLEVDFRDGEAAHLPVPDASVDVVLSNFGVIFAPDPAAAAAETVRVLVPGGRLAFSAWLPGGAVVDMNAAAMAMVRTALGAPTPPPGFPWHDQTALSELFDGCDRLETEQHELVFTASSPAQYLEETRTSHPMAVSGFEVLERAGQAEAARERLLRILEDGNEDDSAFRCTSRYVVATATVPNA